MTQALFRVGRTYRDTTGEACTLFPNQHGPDGKLLAPRKGWGDLIPGELHCVNGSWEPVEEAEEESELPELVKHFIARESTKDAAMIARDGVAPKATTVALPADPLPTAHQAVKGLTYLGPIGHLVDPSHLLKT